MDFFHTLQGSYQLFRCFLELPFQGTARGGQFHGKAYGASLNNQIFYKAQGHHVLVEVRVFNFRKGLEYVFFFYHFVIPSFAFSFPYVQLMSDPNPGRL